MSICRVVYLHLTHACMQLGRIVEEIMIVDSMQRLEAIHMYSQSLTCSLQLAGPSTDRANMTLIMRISITIEGLET